MDDIHKTAQQNTWVVHKFGGTSLANAERYERVAAILETRTAERSAVVVSAMAGVTNRLIRLVELARGRDATYRRELDALRDDQFALIERLLPPAAVESLESRLKDDLRDIEDVLRAVWLLGSASATVMDLISGYGELWSAQVLSRFLASRGHATDWLDAREVLRVAPGELGPQVDWAQSEPRLVEWLASRQVEFVIITGFIATGPAGIPTTLGRNGSDFSASIFGALLHAREIHIWTDVDGVMSANPRQVPDAQVLAALSYKEAMELAYFGAGVMHPRTMAPAIEQRIPIFIRNTFRPELPGTRIHPAGDDLTAGEAPRVKGFATIDQMALVNVEGTGMMGVPGIAHRLFGALREAGVSVVMISQASSEHSICFAVPQAQAAAVRDAVQQGFFAALHLGQIQTIDITENCSILAVVGDQMAGMSGVAAKFFGALGKAGVNIRAIAQGSSERNISVVVDQADATRALRAAHSGFYLSNQTLSVGIIGPGNVGQTLLTQLGEQLARLREAHRVDIRVRGIMGQRQMLCDERSIDLDHWREAFDRQAIDADLNAFVDHIQTDYHPHAVLIDCTASDEVAAHYADWLARGIHVITPNKRANTASMQDYRRLKAASRGSQRHYLYETTVGAGLPIVQTLRDLIQTGDEVAQIQGIFSGTLSYLFNAFDGERPFSEILRHARELGYTEPDPRDDLSGMDVARKVVILAREMGMSLELSDVQVESLVPPALRDASTEDFMAALPDYDDEMARRLSRAREQGKVLRFVGAVARDGHASVRLCEYDLDHPFARIRLTDNIVEFRTRRYHENPLIVQGPGAGPEVTAGGIFADLLRLAAYVGATF